MSCSANSLGSKTQKPVSDRKITEHEFTFFVWCSRKHHFSTKRHKLLVLFYFALTKYRGPDVSTEYVRAQWVPYYNIHERSIFFFFDFPLFFFGSLLNFRRVSYCAVKTVLKLILENRDAAYRQTADVTKKKNRF